MPASKRTAAEKRTNLPRDSKKADDFIRSWKRLLHSGKHDLNLLKEVMMLLIANDAPLPPEWKDHKLTGPFEGMRECHIKGDLVLVYQIHNKGERELVMFIDVGTHSEIF